MFQHDSTKAFQNNAAEKGGYFRYPKTAGSHGTNGTVASPLLWSNLWNRKVKGMDMGKDTGMAMGEQGLKTFPLLKVFWFNPHSQLVHIHRDFWNLQGEPYETHTE